MLVSLLALLAGRALATCSDTLQILQVQDASSTYSHVLSEFAVSEVVREVVSQLGDKLDVEYGLARYSDKPAPIVGYGPGWALWKQYPLMLRRDTCFELIRDVRSNFKSHRVRSAGGKDAEENQFGALAKAAKVLGRADGEGLRVALLVTDTFAHVGRARHHDHSYGLSTTYHDLMTYYRDYFGDFATDWMQRGGLIDSDFARAPKVDVDGVQVKGQLAYRMLVVCKTRGVTLPPASAKVFAKFADEVSRHLVDAGHHLPSGPHYDTTDWEIFCAENIDDEGNVRRDGPFAFALEPGLVKPEAITEYPYHSTDIDDDCTQYEYPDPSDERYGQIFKDNLVLPVILVTPRVPTDKQEFFGAVFYGMANNCPAHFRAFVTADSLDGMWQAYLQCLRGFYEGYMQDMAAHGVAGLLRVVPTGSVSAHFLGSALAGTIQSAVDAVCAAGRNSFNQDVVFFEPLEDVSSTSTDSTGGSTAATTASTTSTLADHVARATQPPADRKPGQAIQEFLITHVSTAGGILAGIGVLGGIAAAAVFLRSRPHFTYEQQQDLEMEYIDREQAEIFRSKAYF